MPIDCYIYGAGVRGKKLAHVLEIICNGAFRVVGFIDKKMVETRPIPCYLSTSIFSLKKEKVVFVSLGNEDDVIEVSRDLHKHFNIVFGKEITDFFLDSYVSAGYQLFMPIGHFYSLYPIITGMTDENEMEKNCLPDVQEIDFNETVQMNLWREMEGLCSEILPWISVNDDLSSDYRYRMGNDSFSDGDARVLFAILNKACPREIIEVGSGWTSALLLDINEYIWKGKCDIKHIEPNPGLLKQVVKNTDHPDLLECGLEEVPISVFKELKEGDVLFIDSTHVSKRGGGC